MAEVSLTLDPAIAPHIALFHSELGIMWPHMRLSVENGGSQTVHRQTDGRTNALDDITSLAEVSLALDSVVMLPSDIRHG